MAIRFLSRHSRSAFALLVTTSLAAWGASARGSVLLITLPAGDAAIEKGSQNAPEIWPWGTSARPADLEGASDGAAEGTDDGAEADTNSGSDADDNGGRPTVSLAPDLSMSEPSAEEVSVLAQKAPRLWTGVDTVAPGATGSLLGAISAALTQIEELPRQSDQTASASATDDSIAWSFQSRAIGMLTFPLGASGRNAWGEAFARWGQHGSELREALCDQGVLYRLFRASIEAEQLALIENGNHVEEARLEPAPTVAAAVHLPTVVSPARLRLSILARPLVRSAAEMLTQAGDSLHNAATHLESLGQSDSEPANEPLSASSSTSESTEASPSASQLDVESPSETQSVSDSESRAPNESPADNETTPLQEDPAADLIFGF